MDFMVRTQLYLPEELYKALKAKASVNNMTFASYVRVRLEAEAMGKDDKKYVRYPFLKFSGMLKGSKGASNNDEIDKVIYGF